MKTWKRLASGLLSLVLAASLTGTALAAETAKTTGETAKTAAAETPKPAGPFSRWFAEMGVNPEDPKASEAVLASMGTVIQQAKTVGKETLTLNAAVWEGNSVHLSLTAKSPNFPKHLDGYSWLSSDKCTARMPEAQWKEYVENKIAIESAGKNLPKEEQDQWFQNLMNPEQTGYLKPHLGVVSREGDTVQLAATMLLENYRENPEVTLRIENVAIIGNGMSLTTEGLTGSLLKGPFEFTFTLDKVLPSMNYEGEVSVTYGKVPLRVRKFSVSPSSMVVDCDIDTQGSAKIVNRRSGPVSGKTISVEKDLKLALNGLWTKDGKYMDCTAYMGITITGTGTPANPGDTVSWDRQFPYPLDPAAVTAVDIGGTRVELGGMTLLK